MGWVKIGGAISEFYELKQHLKPMPETGGESWKTFF